MADRKSRPSPMRRARLIFAWYDLWIGAYIDRPNQRLYLFPVPCLGLVIDWSPRPPRTGTPPRLNGADG